MPYSRDTFTNRVFIGTFIDTPTPNALRIRHDLAIGINSSGTIRFVEPSASLDSALAAHGFSKNDTHVIRPEEGVTSFYFPGFIDTHTHAPQFPNTGIFGNSTLLDWLETYTFPMEASMKDLERAERVYRQAVYRSLENGTTCAAYYATLHVPATKLLADICYEYGQRALIGRSCMDRMSPENYRDESPESAVAATKEVMAHCKHIDPEEEIVRPVITPRFALSCTRECLAALGRLHQATGAYCQTHVSENKDEIAKVHELFPEARDYVSVYDGFKLLSERTILAHAVHLSENEVRLIQSRKAKVSHCPTSNTALTSGAARVKRLMKAGVTVGLGTDMSGGYSASIREVAKEAMMVSRHVAMEHGNEHKLSLEEALYLATMGGAETAGLGGMVGSFEVNKRFDAQLLVLDEVGSKGGGREIAKCPGQVDCFGWESWPDRVAKWLWTGDDRNTWRVYVNGREVFTRGRRHEAGGSI